jgi:hypothetical protein
MKYRIFEFKTSSAFIKSFGLKMSGEEITWKEMAYMEV